MGCETREKPEENSFGNLPLETSEKLALTLFCFQARDVAGQVARVYQQAVAPRSVVANGAAIVTQPAQSRQRPGRKGPRGGRRDVVAISQGLAVGRFTVCLAPDDPLRLPGR